MNAGDVTPMEVHDPAGARVETHPKYPLFRHVAPLPGVSLMDSIGAATLENFYIVGEAWAAVVCHYAKAGDTLLDIGCGCGRTARFFLMRPELRYVGMDVFGPAIAWAERYLEPLAPPGAYRFVHVDAYSAHYNPRGRLKASEVRFPVEDGSVDIAFAASLFTHLLEPDARHYLAESARAVRAGGLLIASIHDEPPAGVRYSGREDRIDVEKAHFVELARAAGFELHEDLGLVCGQQTFAFERR